MIHPFKNRTIVNPVIRDKVTFIQTATETGGRFTHIEVLLQPGGGNTLHYHKTYAETFLAVEGILGINIGKNRVEYLRPGQSFTIMPMIEHRFFNPGKDPVIFQVTIEPGHAGFEKSLQIAYGLATDGLTDQKSIPRKWSHTALLVSMSDMNVPGLMTWISPLLKTIARRARRKGVEKKLVEKYCFQERENG